MSKKIISLITLLVLVTGFAAHSLVGAQSRPAPTSLVSSDSSQTERGLAKPLLPSWGQCPPDSPCWLRADGSHPPRMPGWICLTDFAGRLVCGPVSRGMGPVLTDEQNTNEVALAGPPTTWICQTHVAGRTLCRPATTGP